MNTIVVITTVFQASIKYLDDFFKSLNNQLERNFDVLIMNDGVENFESFVDKYPSLKLVVHKCNKSPAKNRQIGIETAKKLNYKKIIWGDSDDFFPNNRILELSKLLDKHNIVVNDLHSYIDGRVNKNLFGRYYKKGLYDFNEIMDKNIIGFSNLAVNAKIIPEELNFGDDLIAIDWFFATILLMNKNNFYFTTNTFSYYRQHDLNTIGANDCVDSKKINLGIKVKLAHFYNLIICTKGDRKLNKLFSEKYEEILNLKNKLLDSDFKKLYEIEVKKKLSQRFLGWWGEILTTKQFEKDENKINK